MKGQNIANHSEAENALTESKIKTQNKILETYYFPKNILKADELLKLEDTFSKKLIKDIPSNIEELHDYKMIIDESNNKIKTVIYDNGDKYEGQLTTESQKIGIGTLVIKNEFKIFGEFENDQLNGNGELSFLKDPIFAKYKGSFFQNQFHGKGKLEYQDGSSYKGEFRNNLFSGKGIFKYNGNISSQDENNENKGMFENYENIEKQNFAYIGGFVEGAFHGFGILRFEDDSKFFGHWKDGEISNKGIFRSTKDKATYIYDVESRQFEKVSVEDEFFSKLPCRIEESLLKEIEARIERYISMKKIPNKRKVDINQGKKKHYKWGVFSIVLMILFFLLLKNLMRVPQSPELIRIENGWEIQNKENQTQSQNQNVLVSVIEENKDSDDHYIKTIPKAYTARKYEYLSATIKTLNNIENK